MKYRFVKEDLEEEMIYFVYFFYRVLFIDVLGNILSFYDVLMSNL